MQFSKKPAVALAAVALAALAGCGPDAGKGGERKDGAGKGKADVQELMASDANTALRKTADETGKATSVTVSMTGTSEGKPTKAHGVVKLGGPLTAEIVSDDADGGPTTVRMIGTTFYVQVPAKDRATYDGKSWMKMELGGKGKTAAGMAGQFDDINPGAQVRTLIDSGTATVVGKEDIAGVKTVHYASAVPLAKYVAQLDEKLRAEVDKQLTAKGVKEIKVDLWVDEQYRLRRSRGVMGDTDMTVDYTDYGKPVTVAAPPAADTVDFDEMMSKIGGGG